MARYKIVDGTAFILLLIRLLGGCQNRTVIKSQCLFHGLLRFCQRTIQIYFNFADMMSLIKWVKDIGASAIPKDIYMGKDHLLRANDYYNTHFRDRLGVYATFEVMWVEAKR